jgi:hypothetical protein
MRKEKKISNLIKTKLKEFLIENSKDILKKEFFNTINILGDEIKGGLLTKKQAEELQKEIESNYTPYGEIRFGNDNKDIRTNVFNYDYPIAEKTLNGVNLRIAHGLIRNKKQTYLLYADGLIVGEFYSVNDIKKVVKYIEDNLIKTIPTGELPLT